MQAVSLVLRAPVASQVRLRAAVLLARVRNPASRRNRQVPAPVLNQVRVPNRPVIAVAVLRQANRRPAASLARVRNLALAVNPVRLASRPARLVRVQRVHYPANPVAPVANLASLAAHQVLLVHRVPVHPAVKAKSPVNRAHRSFQATRHGQHAVAG